jgi:tyrosinase
MLITVTKLSSDSWQYWDFGKWTDPEKSPIFDGSDTSMSGNGKKVSHKATSVGPAQNGGGCVETGPFAK